MSGGLGFEAHIRLGLGGFGVQAFRPWGFVLEVWGLGASSLGVGV